jgi:hypothetical protein
VTKAAPSGEKETVEKNELDDSRVTGREFLLSIG